MFLLPDAKVAYIADNVTPNRVGFTIMPDFDVDEWKRTLGEYLDIDFDKAVYSHNNNPDAIKGGDKEDIKQFKEFLEDIQEGIEKEIAEGTNPFAVPSILNLPKYKDWAQYDDWLEMNIWAVFLRKSPKLLKPKKFCGIKAIFG